MKPLSTTLLGPAEKGYPGGDLPSDESRVRLLSASFARLRLSLMAMPAMGLLFGWLLARQGGEPLGLFVWGAVYVGVLWAVSRMHSRFRHDQLARSATDVYALWQPRVRGLAGAHGLALALSVWLSLEGASYDYMLLLHVTLLGISAANGAQMTGNLGVYRALYFGMSAGLVMMPWSFPDHWQFVLPMSLVMNAVIYRSSLSSHRFYVRQVVLEERSADLAARYREASQTAERALAEKNHFLSSAAHDLRQPVHAMALLAEALALQGNDPDRAQALWTQWRLSMRSVNHMFDALLDLSRIESGTLAVRPEAVRLAALFDDVHWQFAADAGARGLTLRVHRPPAGAAVWADAALVRQSLANLVQNALRYTESGGVLVGARRRGGDWQIQVWDTGIGIPLQEQASIYQPFFRAPHAWQLARSGHGLGLAVVARCVALMNATQGLQSRVARGSCFWLQLPAASPAAALPPEHRLEGPAQGAGLQGRCLVLDDDPQVRKAWSALLGAWGVEVQVAADATEAMAALDAGFSPEGILCDQRLRSGESGFEVLCALLARCPRARGAMVSGEFDSPDLQTAQDEGYLVLRKPVDVDVLHAVLSQWFRAADTPDASSTR